MTTSADNWLLRGGETGRLIADRDWSNTALGPIHAWPQSLKTALGIVLMSPVPIVMLWGQDGVMLYNDAYSTFAGGRHPSLLGCKVSEGWPEVADFNENVMKVGLSGGTLAYRDQELILFRHGSAEQVWMNLDYSPVLDEAGKPVGVIAIVTETTERVKASQRLTSERERLFQAFEQAPGFIISMRGPTHEVEFVNAAHRRAFSSAEWTGKTIREAFPDVADQGFFEMLDRVYSTGEGAGETVLVIDDESTVRMLIVEVLEEAGYRAIEAVDGPAGLKVLQSDSRIDLLVTDVGLPGGINGRQVADAARLTRPNLKVLFVTGFAENAAVGNGHLEPGMEIITKPFVMTELANKITEMIES